ncbi:hypothetical protein EJ02DRAFT_484899, partial [Clathrospora elynae]
PVSDSTVRQLLARYGYRHCVAASKPFLNATQRAQRLTFARRIAHWEVRDFYRVVCSDKAAFHCSGHRRHLTSWSCQRFFSRTMPPAYAARATQPALGDAMINLLEWPSNLPDFNSIEDVWRIIEDRIDEMVPRPWSKQAMPEAAFSEW